MAGVARAARQTAAPVLARRAGSSSRQLLALSGAVARTTVKPEVAGTRLIIHHNNNSLFAIGSRSFSQSRIWRSAEVSNHRGGSKLWESADEAVADIQSGSVLLSSGFGLCGVACKFPVPVLFERKTKEKKWNERDWKKQD
jgi:3-oxoacid CoA-transferase